MLPVSNFCCCKPFNNSKVHYIVSDESHFRVEREGCSREGPQYQVFTMASYPDTLYGVYAVKCTPCTRTQCALHTVYTLHCVHNVQFTLPTVYTLHCVHYTHCTIYTAHCVQSTLCTLHTVYNLHCIQFTHFTVK